MLVTWALFVFQSFLYWITLLEVVNPQKTVILNTLHMICSSSFVIKQHVKEQLFLLISTTFRKLNILNANKIDRIFYPTEINYLPEHALSDADVPVSARYTTTFVFGSLW